MPLEPHTTLAIEDGVAIITLVNPPVNALHPKGVLPPRLPISRRPPLFDNNNLRPA